MEAPDDLVARLLTLAGEIMEDVSPVAIVRGLDIDERIAIVRQAGADIESLVEAAEVALRRR